MAIGIALGLLVGLLSGAALLVLLRNANGAKIEKPASILAILVQMLAIPALWFGGPWLATGLVRLVPLGEMINPYLVTLATAFAAIVILPLAALIRGTERPWLWP
jgi:hypothetical protein